MSCGRRGKGSRRRQGAGEGGAGWGWGERLSSSQRESVGWAGQEAPSRTGADHTAVGRGLENITLADWWAINLSPRPFV